MNIKFFLLSFLVIGTTCSAMDIAEKTHTLMPFQSTVLIFPKPGEKLKKRQKQDFYKKAISDVFGESAPENIDLKAYRERIAQSIPMLIGQPDASSPAYAEDYKKLNKADIVLLKTSADRIINSTHNNIDWLKAVIASEGARIDVSLTIACPGQQQAQSTCASLTIEIESKKANCLTIHPQTCQLFVGCNDGTISIYKFSSQSDNSITKEVSIAFSYTHKPITAIKFFDNNGYFITHSEDGSCIWHISLNRPRMFIPGQPQKGYIKNQFSSEYTTGWKLSKNNTGPLLIIRSHANKGWVYDTDLNYYVPLNYVNGSSPLNDKQESLLYLLSIFSKRTSQDPQLVEQIKNLYSHNDSIRSFEPEVSLACLTFLEEVANHLNISLK